MSIILIKLLCYRLEMIGHSPWKARPHSILEEVSGKNIFESDCLIFHLSTALNLPKILHFKAKN